MYNQPSASRGKRQSFFALVTNRNNILTAMAAKKVFEWAYLFQLPYLLHVLTVLNSWRWRFWYFQIDNRLFYGHSIFQKINIVIVFCFKSITATNFTVKRVIREKL